MTSPKKILTIALTAAFAVGVSLSQTTRTVGATGADYASLKAASDAINAGTLSRAIQLNIVDNTTETASAVLNASGLGSANYTSVSISPTGGSTRTISGSLAGSPLVDFNGADNVTFDGVNTSSNALTIVNQSTSSTVGTSTIRFRNDATGNTITNCTINGAATVLLSEELSPGTYAQQWNAVGLASGVYFYRLQAGNFVETKKLILFR